MKFAKYLHEEVVPEWRKAYINYKQGKKYLKAIEAAIKKKEEESKEAKQNIPAIDLGLAGSLLDGPITQEPESEELLGQSTQNHPSSDVYTYPSPGTTTTPIMKNSHLVKNYEAIVPSAKPSADSSVPGTIQSDNISQSKLKSDSLQPHRSIWSKSSEGDNSSKTDFISQQIGVAARAQSQLIKELTQKFVTVSNQRHAKARGIQVEGKSFDEIMDQLLDEEKTFFRFLDTQLELIDDFYRDKELEAVTKLKVLKQQIFVADEWKRRHDHKIAKAQAQKAWYQNEWSRVRHEIGNLMADTSVTHDVTLGLARANPESTSIHQNGNIVPSRDLSGLGSSTGIGINTEDGLRQRENRAGGKMQPPIDQMKYQSQLVVDDEENRRQRMNHSVARTRIKTALYEFYRSLEMLKNYKVETGERILNNTGFVKIMKKFDKTAGWKASKMFAASKLRPAYFMKSNILDELLEEVENLFIEKFENGQRRRGMAKLRIPDTKNQSHNAASARVGLYLGLSIPLFVRGIQGALSEATQARIPYWDSLLVVYGGIFIAVLFTCLFGVNMYAWSKSRINYKFIFEFDPRDNLDFHQFFELPTFFMFLLCLSLYIEFDSEVAVHFAISYYPLILLCIFAAIMFCPLPIANWGARKWILQSMGRLLVSGYHHVEFRDFFLADEFNSLTYSIEQIEFAICAYTHDWYDAAIPSWLRFLQCLRRFRDTLEWFPHLLNAGKYMSSLIQLFVYFSFRHYGGTSLKVSYIVISIFTSIYTYTWDVYMDWGLFRFGKYGGGAFGHPFLRPELVYPKMWVYYLAIILDFFGRFAWILRLVPMGLNGLLLSFTLALAEMLRRWMWNFFRLENEHLNNCGQFRAIKDIPLPFHIHIEGSSDEEEIEDDASVTESQSGVIRPGSTKSSRDDQLKVVDPERNLSPNFNASGPSNLRKQSLARSSSSYSGKTVNRSSSAEAVDTGRASVHSNTSQKDRKQSLRSRSTLSLVPYGLQRSNTFVDNAITEAGIGEDRKEQLATANKFYERRDFDTKIESPIEDLFRIRKKSGASSSQNTELGIDMQGTRSRQIGSGGRRVSDIFGWRPSTDEDDTEEDDEA
ncbi:hypothetical protein BGZ76_007725 [Entomortierella beljakovae]|nr:hypothetical protein BGZ76_007725 [Entomortierella beljakovae]